MGFWEDASPATKGAIVVGGITILYFLIAMFTGLPPYGAVDEETAAPARGITAPP